MAGLFSLGGIKVRQVTSRNAPTVINAVFNLRNFWDGRASNIFNECRRAIRATKILADGVIPRHFRRSWSVAGRWERWFACTQAPAGVHPLTA
jgi:hypothetical protein